MTFVVDASVAVEVLFRTPTGEAALSFLGEETLVAPELLDAEVLSFIRRKTLQGVISTKRAVDAVRSLAEWPITRVSHRLLLEAAFRLRENVSAYDALYVAVAIATGAEIVTADGALARASLGSVVHNVRV